MTLHEQTRWNKKNYLITNNNLISEKHKKVCKASGYFKYFLIFVIAVSSSEVVAVNNVLRVYNEMKEDFKNLKNDVIYTI